MTRWRWDAVHHAIFPHQGLDAVAVLRPLSAARCRTAATGARSTSAPCRADIRSSSTRSPATAQIIDLSPANDSRFLDAVGESGHPLSPHYDDFLRDWRRVKHRRMRMDRADIETGAIGTLRLTPSRV